MNSQENRIRDHYEVTDLESHIFGALEKLGYETDCISPKELSAVDEFHIRGIESTKELADLLDLSPEMTLLDVGCGLGGSCRYLTGTYGVKTTGVDLTEGYCRLAAKLSKMSGFDGRINFHCSNATEMPYEDNSFDVVWTEHAQMNIEDKEKFYREIWRVLKPGGRLAFHDIFSGSPDRVIFPVPWADDDSISYLLDKEEARNLIQNLDFDESKWIDVTDESGIWFQALADRVSKNGPPLLGVHLYMRGNAVEKLQNLARNLVENRIQVVQAVFEKS